MLHYDGQRFEQIDSGTTRSLFTVHALGERAAAVGGFGTGILLESDGGAWRDVTPEGAVQMIGVCLTADGGGYAVGLDGTVMRRDDDGWALERTALPVVDALHAVWVDPEGGVWAVGGQVLSFPLVEGVMIHRE